MGYTTLGGYTALHLSTWKFCSVLLLEVVVLEMPSSLSDDDVGRPWLLFVLGGWRRGMEESWWWPDDDYSVLGLLPIMSMEIWRRRLWGGDDIVFIWWCSILMVLKYYDYCSTIIVFDYSIYAMMIYMEGWWCYTLGWWWLYVECIMRENGSNVKILCYSMMITVIVMFPFITHTHLTCYLHGYDTYSLVYYYRWLPVITTLRLLCTFLLMIPSEAILKRIPILPAMTGGCSDERMIPTGGW